MKRQNKVYNSLYKKHLIIGVPIRFFALECTLSGIIVFVLRIYFLFFCLCIIHIVLALVIKKESEIKEVINFYLKLKKEEKYEI